MPLRSLLLLLILLSASIVGVSSQHVTLTTDENPASSASPDSDDDAPVTPADEAAEPDMEELVAKATENAKTEEQKAVEMDAARKEGVGNGTAVAAAHDLTSQLKVVEEVGMNVSGDVEDPVQLAELVHNATLQKLNESGLNETWLNASLNASHNANNGSDATSDALAEDLEQEADLATAEADAAAEAAHVVTPLMQAPADADKQDMHSNSPKAETNRAEHLRWRYKHIEERARWINNPVGGLRPIQANQSQVPGQLLSHNGTHVGGVRNSSTPHNPNGTAPDDVEDPFATDESGFPAPDWTKIIVDGKNKTEDPVQPGPVFYNDTKTNKTEEDEVTEVMDKRNKTLNGILGIGNQSSLPSLRSMTMKISAFGDDSQMGLALTELTQHNNELTALEFRLLFLGENATATAEGKAQLAKVVKVKIVSALREVNHIISLHKGFGARALSVVEIRAVLSSLQHMLRIVRKAKTLGILKSRPSLQRALEQKEQQDAAEAQKAKEEARVSESDEKKKEEKKQQTVIPGDAGTAGAEEVRCPTKREICEMNMPCYGTCPCPICPVGGDSATYTESGDSVQQGSAKNADVTMQRDEVLMTAASAPQRHSVRP